MLFIEADAEVCQGKKKTVSSFKNNQYVWDLESLSIAMSPESQRRKGGSKLFMQKLCEQKCWVIY